MIDKIAVVARLLNILLAVVAGIVAIPGFDVVTALIILGLIAGLGIKDETFLPLLVATVALPVMAGVLGQLPAIGLQLSDIFANFGIAVAASMAMAFALGTFQYAKRDLGGLSGKSD